MKNRRPFFITLLFWVAIAGNILFALWVLYNAIDEGFRGTLPEKASGVGLISLLMINSFLILNKREKAVHSAY